MKPTHPLLSEIDRFLAARGWSETTFGLRAVNDGKFVGALRKGRRVWPETEARVRHFIDAQVTAASAEVAAE